MERFRLTVLQGALLVSLVGCDSRPSAGPTAKNAPSLKKTASASKGGTKIVGTWRFLRSSDNREPTWGTKLDFTADGKLEAHAVGYANAGTYSLDKNTLTFNTVEKHIFTVAKLTDKELVLEIKLGFPHQDATTFEYRKE
jgi:hypothetical protein